jgi:hypothetical protein
MHEKHMKICTFQRKIGIEPAWLAFSYMQTTSTDAENGLEAFVNGLLTIQATKDHG